MTEDLAMNYIYEKYIGRSGKKKKKAEKSFISEILLTRR